MASQNVKVFNYIDRVQLFKLNDYEEDGYDIIEYPTRFRVRINELTSLYIAKEQTQTCDTCQLEIDREKYPLTEVRNETHNPKPGERKAEEGSYLSS